MASFILSSYQEGKGKTYEEGVKTAADLSGK